MAPEVYEDGAQMRDFVHVRDVARANLLALESTHTGTFNVASGTPTSVYDLARELSDAFGSSASEPKITGNFRVGDVRHIVASATHAREVLGFQAEITVADGMRDFAVSHA